MTDIKALKALAEAFPADLDWDSNTEPFFNGPNGESLGGGSTGYYSVYGQPFEIEGEQYDGTEYVSICTKEFAEFVCSARAGVLELIAEIERLQLENGSLRGSCKASGKDLTTAVRACNKVSKERDQLKVENEALRKDAKRYRFLRNQHWPVAYLAVVVNPKVSVKLGHDCPSGDRLDEQVDGAMKREASHD